MKAFYILAIAVSFLAVSCETLDDGPQPERERLSSMPHNFPQSWEGQAGMPGMGGGGGGF